MNKSPYKIKLHNLADVLQGQSPKSEYYSSNEGTPFMQGNKSFGNLYPNITRFTKKVTKLAKKGDVLLSVRAPVGDLNIAPCDLCIGRGLASITAKEGSNEFIYYALKYNIDNLLKKGSATTFKSVNKDIINNFELFVPEDKNDRKKIAGFLSKLDLKIELNNQINHELENISKSIFDFWFLQFDFPDSSDKPFKSNGGRMVRNEVLGIDIPEKWKVGSLEDLGTIVGGSTPSTKDINNFSDNGIPWITPKDLSLNIGNKFISKGEIDVSVQGKKDASLSSYPRGTVLLSSRAPIGYMAIARNELTTNQGFKSFIPNKGYSSSFIYYAIKNSMKAITQYASGSTFKEISGSVLKIIRICLPPKSIAEEFSNSVNSIFSQQIYLEQQNELLLELRNLLLPMLMNGQAKIIEH